MSIGAINEFFTWNSLASYAGATLATAVITQALKGVGFIDRLPTRLFSYIVAVVLLVAATLFLGEASVSALALCLINGAVVSLAANGAFDAVARK